jgi:hypothetical protein
MSPSLRPRTLTLAQARRIVRSTSRGGIARVHGKGCAWFRSRLLPALRILERTTRTREDRRWLSGAYYVVGDIHDFNHAPRAAIAAYRKSLRFAPEQAAAWREIGGMLGHMGDHARARRAYGGRSRWILKTRARRATSPTWTNAALRPRFSVGATLCGRSTSCLRKAKLTTRGSSCAGPVAQKDFYVPREYSARAVIRKA